MPITRTRPHRPRHPRHPRRSKVLTGLAAAGATAAVLLATADPAAAAGRRNYDVTIRRTIDTREWAQNAGRVTIQSQCTGATHYPYTIRIRRGTFGEEYGSKVWDCRAARQSFTFATSFPAGEYIATISKANDGVPLHISGTIIYP